MTTVRRSLLKNSAAVAMPGFNFAQSPAVAGHSDFALQPGQWRTFEVTTRADIAKLEGMTRVWLPVPSVNSSYQQSLESSFSSNGAGKFMQDGQDGAKMLHVEFAVDEASPFVELTSRVQTQSRRIDWAQKNAALEDADTQRYFTRPADLIPTNGIIRKTALAATRGATYDVKKTQKIYDWVVANTCREPKVRGCGEGDIQTMLETANLGSKCADLNAIFIDLCRSAGIPARVVYGIRLAPSRSGYKELSGNPASLKGARHCRAEAYPKSHGWVVMDPADVAKVMRPETPEWIKNTVDPVVAPVNSALLGGWEGNWMAYNTAHYVRLPHSKGDKDGFFMCPMAKNASGWFDPYARDDFKHQITAKEIKA